MWKKTNGSRHEIRCPHKKNPPSCWGPRSLASIFTYLVWWVLCPHCTHNHEYLYWQSWVPRNRIKCHLLQIELSNWLLHILQQSIDKKIVFKNIFSKIFNDTFDLSDWWKSNCSTVEHYQDSRTCSVQCWPWNSPNSWPSECLFRIFNVSSDLF